MFYFLRYGMINNSCIIVRGKLFFDSDIIYESRMPRTIQFAGRDISCEPGDLIVTVIAKLVFALRA